MLTAPAFFRPTLISSRPLIFLKCHFYAGKTLNFSSAVNSGGEGRLSNIFPGVYPQGNSQTFNRCCLLYS